MLESVAVKSLKNQSLIEFLQDNEFVVEQIADTVITARRLEELPVFISVGDERLFFEVDLGNISAVASQEVYFEILDLNTEILPVSLGIDTTNPEDPRLVLVESRETANLDNNELLAVLDAMEIATDKAEAVLSKYIVQKA